MLCNVPWSVGAISASWLNVMCNGAPWPSSVSVHQACGGQEAWGTRKRGGKGRPLPEKPCYTGFHPLLRVDPDSWSAAAVKGMFEFRFVHDLRLWAAFLASALTLIYANFFPITTWLMHGCFFLPRWRCCFTGPGMAAAAIMCTVAGRCPPPPKHPVPGKREFMSARLHAPCDEPGGRDCPT